MRRIDSLPATLSLEEAAGAEWDLIILGAGPAGAMAAIEAGRQGIRVLLIDRNQFPRPKVCGCCVNQGALEILGQAGLKNLPAQLGGRLLTEFRLATHGRTAAVPLAGGIAVSRRQLDAALIETAIEAGVHFLDRVQASIQPGGHDCQIQLKQNGTLRRMAAKVVIVATGLGSNCFANQTENSRQYSPRSRVGAGALVQHAGSHFPAGVLSMACHRDGYAGLVRLEDDRLDIAAALDPSAIKRKGSIAALVAQILEEAGLPAVEGLDQQTWHGTPLLTQRRTKVFGPGYFLIGDAAGYVEPFTGEGIAWALATGKAVVPFAVRAMAESTFQVGPLWSREYQRLLGRRMLVCRSIRFLLRRPRLMDFSVRLLARWPRLAKPIERSLNAAYFS